MKSILAAVALIVTSLGFAPASTSVQPTTGHRQVSASVAPTDLGWGSGVAPTDLGWGSGTSPLSA